MRIHHSQYAEISYDSESETLRILWSDKTSEMSAEEFKGYLELMAEFAEKHHTPRILVDLNRFKFSPTTEIANWRERHVAPRYNKAGVEKFAYVLPNDAPLPPTPEKPPEAHHATRFFNAEDDATAWLLEPRDG